MTHRERVMTALNHEEPDRIPMDLGGSLATTVVGEAYGRLRAALGLPSAGAKEGLHYLSLAATVQST